jgi:DNA-binding MurR/RpiR family transcriptional regulator
VEVATRIGQSVATLTPAERRVAEVILERPQLVAFGTVAELAEAAGAGAATVVRLATKLGYDGFTALQASVQDHLADQLRPAAERIRDSAASGAIDDHLALVLDNVRATLGALDPEVVGAVVDRLATAGRVVVLSGDASAGVAAQFAADLTALRDGVVTLAGNPVAVRRQAALVDAGDAVVCLDLRRYDRWVVQTLTAVRRQNAWVAAVTDSLLSPLAASADHTLVVAAASTGPFDSHVAMLALLDLLVAGVGDRLRADATERLDRAEAAWREIDALTDR